MDYNKEKINEIKSAMTTIVSLIDNIKVLDQKAEILNICRFMLHEISPWKDEPVDFVEWVKNEFVHANDYNPNKVAPPEMKLLKLSISEDGYTQPIVSDKIENDNREVVDGFHRKRVGTEFLEISSKLYGYLPVVTIRNSNKEKKCRISSTVRHNRARGIHTIKGMSNIVLELDSLGYDDVKISKHLGMEPEEVLRLKQITGLPQIFSNHEFSKSWDEFESKIQSKYKDEIESWND